VQGKFGLDAGRMAMLTELWVFLARVPGSQLRGQSYFDPWLRDWDLTERMLTPRNSDLCGTVAGIA
jgi:hypothetical protein